MTSTFIQDDLSPKTVNLTGNAAAKDLLSMDYGQVYSTPICAWDISYTWYSDEDRTKLIGTTYYAPNDGVILKYK